ncbi:MAG: type II toxin-antitoxin system RelE/ParE family toxin [Thermoanaerobaculia bacterium]
MKPVRPNEAAEREFHESIAWYEKECPGLGDRLWTEIQTAISHIETHPAIGEAVQQTRRKIRRVPLRHFPFFLVYREHEDYLEVVALAHMSRRPRYWRDRTR